MLNSKSQRLLLAETVFWTHASLIGIFLGLFLVPLSVWPGRLAYQFYYALAVWTSQLLWGGYLYYRTGRPHMVCPLTSMYYWLQGRKLTPQFTWNDTFTADVCRRLSIPMRHSVSRIITSGSFMVVGLRYLFFR